MEVEISDSRLDKSVCLVFGGITRGDATSVGDTFFECQIHQRVVWLHN
jgi:hypothetical protein